MAKQKASILGIVMGLVVLAMCAISIVGLAVDEWTLVSVDSEIDEQARNYEVEVTLDADTVADRVDRAMDVDLWDYSGDPDDWFEIEDYTEGGSYVARIRVGDEVVSGRYLRENVLGLRSAAFDIDCDGEEFTFTIPSTASRVITAGAYNGRTFSYADFSGRGGEGEGYRTKPDLAAPGVGVVTRVPGGGTAAVTGTSFAVPFVTGAAALLMEWGIVRGNDPYLYGEKMKAYLRSGARQLTGSGAYPNNLVGYGALCAGDSIPETR